MKKFLLVSILCFSIIGLFGISFSVEPMFTTVQVGEMEYLFYSITPVFDFNAIKIGFGINMFQDEIGGQFYYGNPRNIGSDGTDNLLNAFSLNFLELNFKSFGARYGHMNTYTHGLGLLMHRYSVPFAKSFDVRLGKASEGINLKAHVPFQIDSWSPFELSQSSKLYFMESTLSLGNLKLSLLGGTNLSLNEDSPSQRNDYIGSAGIYYDLLFLNTGVEAAVIITEDAENPDNNTFGYLAGIGGGFDFGFLTFRALPILYMTENTVIGYIDRNYYKEENHTKFLDDKRVGGLFEINSNVSDIFNGNIRFTYNFDSFPVGKIENEHLEGLVRINSPFEDVPFIVSGFYSRTFKEDNFFNIFEGLFNEYTTAEYVISYPLFDGLYISYVNYFSYNYENPEESGFKNRVDMQASLNF